MEAFVYISSNYGILLEINTIPWKCLSCTGVTIHSNKHYDSSAIVNFRITRSELLSVFLRKQNLVTARRGRVKQETKFRLRDSEYSSFFWKKSLFYQRKLFYFYHFFYRLINICRLINIYRLINICYLLYGSVSQGLGTTKFTNLIG